MSIHKLRSGLVVCRWPVIGYVIIATDGKREYDWPDTALDIAVQWREPEGFPIRIYLGHPQTGPLVVLHSGGTDNPSYATPCWSKGNFGKNFACGGNWGSYVSERNSLKDPPCWKLEPTLRQAIAMRLDRNGFSQKRLEKEPPELTTLLWAEFGKIDTAMTRDKSEPITVLASRPLYTRKFAL